MRFLDVCCIFPHFRAYSDLLAVEGQQDYNENDHFVQNRDVRCRSGRPVVRSVRFIVQAVARAERRIVHLFGSGPSLLEGNLRDRVIRYTPCDRRGTIAGGRFCFVLFRLH